MVDRSIAASAPMAVRASVFAQTMESGWVRREIGVAPVPTSPAHVTTAWAGAGAPMVPMSSVETSAVPSSNALRWGAEPRARLGATGCRMRVNRAALMR